MSEFTTISGQRDAAAVQCTVSCCGGEQVPPFVACRYEIDKLTASQRLDLNLEKGRMRDELQMLRDKTNELEIKVGRE